MHLWTSDTFLNSPYKDKDTKGRWYLKQFNPAMNCSKYRIRKSKNKAYDKNLYAYGNAHTYRLNEHVNKLGLSKAGSSHTERLSK